MVASNVAGFTKKSVASAMMFMAYTTGNIIGPFLFFPREAPEYSVSQSVTMIKVSTWDITDIVDSERFLGDFNLLRHFDRYHDCSPIRVDR